TSRSRRGSTTSAACPRSGLTLCLAPPSIHPRRPDRRRPSSPEESMKHCLILLLGFFPAATLLGTVAVEVEADDPADLIVCHAKVITVDDQFRLAEAVAITGDRITAVGSDKDVLRHQGPKTKVIEAKGR